LGAGASREADAPSWRRLIENISLRFCPRQFDRIEKYFSRSDPWGAADLVCNNSPRPELEVLVRDTLETTNPTAAHAALTNVTWAAIFTTNYDTLVEKAYEQTPTTRRQEPRPVYQFSTDFNIHNNANVHIFKLHGSIDQIHNKQNILVLTTKDRTDTHAARSAMLSVIPRLLLDYYWLFIGYSFTDNVLRELLAELRRANRDVMPRSSFALMPKLTDEDKEFFDQYSIRTVPGSMAPFMAAVQEHIEREAAGRQRVRRIPDLVQTGGRDLTFLPQTRVAMDDQFEFVGPVDADYDGDGFLIGGEPSWGNLAAGLDFRRDTVADRIKSDVLRNIGKAPTKGIIIAGAAGSGKSSVLRRIGYEVSTDRDCPYPVLLLRDFYRAGNRYSESWDWRLVSEVSKASGGSPVVLLVDNVEVYHRMVRNLFSDLRAHNVPALLLGAVRALDWSNIIEDHPMPGFGVHTVPDDLEGDEVDAFVTYLERRRLITIDAVTTHAYWRGRVKGHHEHHLLGVMRSLSTKAEENFDQKIISEYGNLPDLARRAYEAICLIYRFGRVIPLDLLLIVLNCSEPQFGDEVLNADREHVIISAASTLSGRVAYRARHRVIAEIVSDHVWTTQYEACDALTHIIDCMSQTSEDDFRLCKGLILSDEVRNLFLDLTYLRKLFESALAQFPTETMLYQQYAIAEMEHRPDPDFAKAHELLNKASALESAKYNPTLQHSRGMLYLHEAGATRDPEIHKHFEKKAEREFIAYRKRDKGSEYGYYTHARMLNRQRREMLADQRVDKVEASKLLAKALEIVREGIATVEEEYLVKLPILEADLLKEISPAEALQNLDRWIRHSPTQEGFYLRGVIELAQGKLGEAEADVDRGLKIAPEHRGLLLLRITLLKRRGDYDSKALLDALRSAMIHAPDSPLLAFEAGVTAYHLGNIGGATEFFDRAFHITGRAGRLRSYMVTVDPSVRQLHRRIEELAKRWGHHEVHPPSGEPNLTEATGVIESQGRSKRVRRDGYGDLLHVRMQDDVEWAVAGLPVAFNIGFNFRGPVAFNLRKRDTRGAPDV
jgi:tetratricopeptide (TPR) repeat protein